MKVFDLRCEHDHRFEGWFASSEAYEDQLARDLVACPICASTAVSRLPSAPHLNLSSARAVVPSSSSPGAAPAVRRDGVPERTAERDEQQDQAHRREERGNARDQRQGETGSAAIVRRELTPEAKTAERLQAQWLHMIREVVRNTENVGDAFAEEARKIHYREAPERAIRGVASADQVAELADEGIDVVAMPMPDSVKGSLQ